MKKNIVVVAILILTVWPLVRAQNNSQGENLDDKSPKDITPEQMEEFHRKIGEMLRTDFAAFNRYKEENAKIGPPAPDENRVVFIGNSITEWWQPYWEEYFSDKPYINRGIAGQTTPQILVRFRADVIKLKPKVVVILAGINDITGMTGPTTNEMIEDNLTSMVEIAQANGIRIVLSTALPCFSIVGRSDLHPADRVVDLNAWIKKFASEKGCIYLDYFSKLKDENNGLKADFTKDGVHPNKAGYDIMAPLAEEAIQKALNK
jgi:lysophospholipase L1-like esterase